MLKDWPKVYERIKDVPQLDEHEKILFARSMAATPEERWAMNVNYLRSLGLLNRRTKSSAANVGSKTRPRAEKRAKERSKQ